MPDKSTTVDASLNQYLIQMSGKGAHHKWNWYHLFPDAERAIHIFLSSILFAFSMVLEMPGETFTSPAFAGFARIGAEVQWGYALAIVSMIGFVGYCARSSGLTTASIFVLATTHGFIARCLYVALPEGQYLTTGTTTYTLIALLGYYLCLLRLSRRT